MTAANRPPARDRAVAEHRRRWGEPEVIARAPGRVNLIGEHTDYNDGFVLPMALPFDTVIAASVGEDRSVEFTSEGYGDLTIDLDNVNAPVDDWALYLAGVFRLMAATDVELTGWRGAIATDIPAGASLSSSAALEVAAIRCTLHWAGRAWPVSDVARFGQRVENEIVGLPTGIMDQLISAGAVEGRASLIDCRSLEVTPRKLPSGVCVAVLDTGTRRRLVDAAYADRRAACERVADWLGVAALRDADLGDLDRLPPEMAVERIRARHVVSENQRTVDAAAAMNSGDAMTLGSLMTDSHISLRDDYEVSGPALDEIVDVATSAPGCLGARLTGGGFAGCAVAIVEKSEIDEFRSAVHAGYSYDGNQPRIWICEPAAGASVGSFSDAGDQ